MRLFKVSLLQEHTKFQLASYFYEVILGIPPEGSGEPKTSASENGENTNSDEAVGNEEENKENVEAEGVKDDGTESPDMGGAEAKAAEEEEEEGEERFAEDEPNGKDYYRYFDRPCHLETKLVPMGDEQPMGGFTGIQLNIHPIDKLSTILFALRATGIKQPDPHDAGDVQLLSVQDPTNNVVMLVAHKEKPDEPLMDEAVGSVSVFVSDLSKARSFYENTMKLPVKATPHPGMVVYGNGGETAILVYQVPPGNPNAPIGRHTGYCFESDDLQGFVEALQTSEGSLAAVQVGSEPGGAEIRGVIFRDPEGNTFEATAATSAPSTS